MDQLFFGIPDEMFRDIFVPFLTIQDIVRLDSAALNHSLRSRLLKKLPSFEFINIDIYDDIARWLCSRSVNLKRIKISPEDSGEALSALGSVLKHATEINLLGCVNLPKKAFTALSKQCQVLSILHLTSCGDVSDQTVSSLGPAFRNLTYLDLSDCEKVGAKTLFNIGKHCEGSKLTTLRLGGCLKVDDACMLPWSKLKSLTELDLGCCGISDKTLQAIATNCTFLRVLDIQDCQKVTDVGILHLIALAGTLEELYFQECTELTDHSLRPLVEACHELRLFGIGNCDMISDDCIEALIRNNASLTECDFSFTTITGGPLVKLATSQPGLLNLNIQYCSNIDSNSICTFLLCCTQLRSLDIGANTHFGTEVAEALIQGSTELVDLNLRDWSDIVNDTFLMSLCKHCPALQALNVSECPHVTDEGIIAVAHALRGLRFLDLSACVEITDASLRALQMFCPCLEQLQVINCRKLTTEAIDAMIELSDAAVTFS